MHNAASHGLASETSEADNKAVFCAEERNRCDEGRADLRLIGFRARFRMMITSEAMGIGELSTRKSRISDVHEKLVTMMAGTEPRNALSIS